MLPCPGFYPEIPGFFEAVGNVLGIYFRIEISGFFTGFLRQRGSEVKSQYFLKLTNKQLYENSLYEGFLSLALN